MKLCNLRPGGSSTVPLVCQLAIRDECKRGELSQNAIGRLYGVDPKTIQNIRDGDLVTHHWRRPEPQLPV